MRILHAILTDGFYGSERYCIELAAEQARMGHAVVVLSHGRDTDCGRRFAEAAQAVRRDDGIRSRGGSLTLTSIPRRLPAALHRPLAWFALRRFAPEIVHSHLNPAARRIGRVAQRGGIPHVATLHLDYDGREHGDCDGLICVARWQRARVPAGFRGGVVVVWNWLPATIRDALARTAPVEVAALRRAWGADEATVVFGSAGRLMHEKGMDWLVSGFRGAFPRGDEKAALVVAGDGPQLDIVRQAAVGDARIVLAGAVERITPFYAAFDAYVSAARFEPFGLTILEAMAAGLPLVLTRTQGPSEFVTDPGVRWVEPDNDGALIAALQDALRHGRQRLRYDLAAFTAARAAGEIEQFYRDTIARRRT